MTQWQRMGLGVAMALCLRCGLEETGAASGGPDAGGGAGGSVSTTGGAWGTGGLGGVAGVDAGDASEDGQAGAAGTAGSGGVLAGGTGGGLSGGSGGIALGGTGGVASGGTGGVATGGSGGTGAACGVVGAVCSGDVACCQGHCGPLVSADPNDCYVFGKCAECDDDGQCGSGRCDACKCEPSLAFGAVCNESSDCTSKKCGPLTFTAPNDCFVASKCADCDANNQCPSGRCDACKCEPKLTFGAVCNEDSDCTSGRCGPPASVDVNDCYVFSKCAECDDDGQCGSGRCDACKCEPKLADGVACNENSDCQNGWCSGNKCK
ncbi:MAG: hypothetical protein IPI67_29565 [Myxococcales bacterium]|nr:hypothetical protein [Myxococcales bacterium]